MVTRKGTKELLSDSLNELMGEESFKNISVQQIAENCGVSKRTFYNHFQDKYELLNWKLSIKQRELARANHETIDWYATALNILEYVKENHQFFSSAYSYDGQNSLTESIYQDICRLYLEFIERIYTPEDGDIEDIKYAIEFFASGAASHIQDWVQDGLKSSPEEIVRKLSLCLPASLSIFFYINPEV